MVVEIPLGVLASGTLKLGTLLVQEIRAARGVAQQFKDIAPKLNIIKALHFEHAYKEEEETDMVEESRTVEAWLTWVSLVAYDVDDLSDEFEIHQLHRGGVAWKVREFFSSNNKQYFYFDVSKKFGKIKENVDKIVQQTPRYLNIIEGRKKRNSGEETHYYKNQRSGKGLVKRRIAAIWGSKTEESERSPRSLNSEIFKFSSGGQNYSTTALQRYNNLSTYLKPCLAYCALFPADYKIKKKLLVQMWIAQGYVRPENKGLDEEDIGNRYFEELVSKSFLVPFEKDGNDNILSYRVHDPDSTVPVCTVMGAEAVLFLKGDEVKISREFRHVSLFNSMNLKRKGKALNVDHVRTFLIIPEDCDSTGYCDYGDDLIQRIASFNLRRLRVLSLNGCKRKRLPKFIGRLCHLRYLDLSYNDVEKIPKSVTRLKCLQTLRVVGCRNLRRLRRDTGEMTSLRHLENDGCPSMSKMPFGIGLLTDLQSLSVFVVGDVKKEDWVGKLSELKGLNSLRGELSIVNLENVNAAESREANLRAKYYLQRLKLEWRREENVEPESVMEGLLQYPPPNLEGLCIRGYGGRSWFPTPSFPCLSQLEIRNCHQLASFDLRSCPLLSSLNIIDCPKLTSVQVHSLHRPKAIQLRGVRAEVWKQLFGNR